MPAKKPAKKPAKRRVAAPAAGKRPGTAGKSSLAISKPAPTRATPANALSLPSGRSIAFVQSGEREELEVRSAAGTVELRIALTAQGPVLSLTGVRLEINATDSVAVRCREFEVDAAEGVMVRSAGDVAIAASGEMRVKSRGQTHVDAELIHLNCGDRTGYPDEETAKKTHAVVERTLAERGLLPAGGPAVGEHTCGEGCDHG